ncbi:MAG TPA: 5-deoxy-glucuronate isomerase [Arenibaculum sp.]|nr:5-deoxy-glucuronate isomerase [Arenibaculum sp.]
MSKLISRPADEDGLVQKITPERAGWSYVGFEVRDLEPGGTLSGETGDREVCLVLVAGRADVTADGETFTGIGDRMSPFEGRKPHAVYIPAGGSWSVTARTGLELAVCSSPGGGDYKARYIGPDDVGYERRGTGSNVRHVYNILPEGEPAHSLLVVEVITPPGNWSSYPSHKHDTDDPPHETYLEETYYHRLNPAGGFALQRVYTDDRSLDEAMAVHDRDVVMVPRGYHPVGAPHGFELYYLNVMAGPVRQWRFRFDPNQQHLLG